jgi:hypothetical protein
VALKLGSKKREFLTAGYAPGRPEVDDDRPAAQVRQTDRGAIERRS